MNEARCWRVDATSNFALETYAERTVVPAILTKSQAERIVLIMNEGNLRDPVYYRARRNDEKLWRGMEELV